MADAADGQGSRLRARLARVTGTSRTPAGDVALAIALTLAALAVVILVRALLALPWPARTPPEDYRPRPDIAVGIVALVFAYVGAMQLRLLGFELATILFLIAAAALLGRMNRTTLALGVVSGLVIGVGATWLFTRFFYIDLPR